MGDLFDFWFEYKTVVPKGYTRFLGCLARLSDQGIKISTFKGNHDMWQFGYLEQELGLNLYSDELKIERNGKKFFLHHGDGIGPGEPGYKLLRAFFRSKICQWLFARFHPNFGIGLANFWSRQSRRANHSNAHADHYLGDEKEFLTQFCLDTLKKEHFDYFIFGHRHLPISRELPGNSHYFNTGDWVRYFSYVVFDGETCELKYHYPNAIAK